MMNEPTDYLTFEERREAERIVDTINAMVAPTIEDAVDLL